MSSIIFNSNVPDSGEQVPSHPEKVEKVKNLKNLNSI